MRSGRRFAVAGFKKSTNHRIVQLSLKFVRLAGHTDSSFPAIQIPADCTCYSIQQETQRARLPSANSFEPIFKEDG